MIFLLEGFERYGMKPPPPPSIAAAPGRCRNCGSTAYTRHELNLHRKQDWRCYACFDGARRIAVIIGILAKCLG